MSKDLRTRYEAVHKHFSTTAMILSIAAIVLALGGGAYAAIHYDKKSSKGLSKAQVIALIKQYAKSGPEGKQGPAGSNGTNGTNGEPGKAGNNGTNGTNGESVTVTETNDGECVKIENTKGHAEICNGTEGHAGTNGTSLLNGTGTPTTQGVEGDFYIDTQSDAIYGPKGSSGWGSGTPLKGENGSPWPGGGTLAPLATETGAWTSEIISEANEKSETYEAIPLPFSVQLEAPIAQGQAVFVSEEEQTNQSGTSYDHCLGSVEAPKAVPGYLCIYQGGTHIAFHGIPTEYSPNAIERPGEAIADSAGSSFTAGRSGAIMQLHYEGPAYVHEMQGSFAVTAPCKSGEEAVEEPMGSGEFVCKPES